MNFSNEFRIVWWFIIVLALSVMLCFRVEAFILGEASAVDFGVLVAWIALFLAPVYSEISLGGIKLRQHIEKAKEEIRGEVASLKSELHAALAVTTQVSQQFTLPSPPANSDLPALEERVKRAVAEVLESQGAVTSQAGATDLNVPEGVKYLFSVRYQIDRELARIAERHDVVTHPRKRLGLGLARELGSLGIIDQRLVGAVHEVYRVCSPAVHGEEPNDVQIEFVRDVGPNVIAALKLVL